ncbi:hypothetical protein CC78DRAFT_613236 [Lojkania enalia]|uniref:AA9 family lytic polysaccharide monooxygenase n=1 Tax=Lojkania enalia TaxID=147567 RepID=A0A9P4KJM5_9PLEO|nr:hypothetical protein CC78DRAFT_613236 [Didymosphaeria enalia]
MKTLVAASLLLATLAEVAQGHYTFQYLTVNGVKGAKYQNVRTNTNRYNPVTALDSNDLRCNAGASSNGGNTTTVAVAAGSTVAFTADVIVYHHGPVTFYMTKVADAVAADGSTDWFKIKEIGPEFNDGQAQWDMSFSYSAQIPSCISPGEYLLRIEHLAIHNPDGVPEFYIACAQVKVTGGGSGSPVPTVKIPGHVKSTDPGYTVNIWDNFHSYTIPGPKVATC